MHALMKMKSIHFSFEINFFSDHSLFIRFSFTISQSFWDEMFNTNLHRENHLKIIQIPFKIWISFVFDSVFIARERKMQMSKIISMMSWENEK